MNKTARYSLIAAICATKLLYLAPTKADKREAVSENVSRDDRNALTGNDLRDGEDIPALPSSLQFDSPKMARERETETLLTGKERAEIRADLLAYRMAEDARQAKIHAPFALAIICA